MSKTLTGYYGAGYTITAGVTNIYIEPGAYLKGGGLVGTAGPYQVSNYGDVKGGGISLADGGTLFNGNPSKPGALIDGAGSGVEMGAFGSVINYGTILNKGPQYTALGAIDFHDGGTVRNGNFSYTTALIRGSVGVEVEAAAGTVTNYGSILGETDQGGGVEIYGGGRIANGSASDTTALISGAAGIAAGGGLVTVVNFGTIAATLFDGADIAAGGGLVNGSRIDVGASIRGDRGVVFDNLAGSVTNFGLIEGTRHQGVALYDGGVVANGSASDKTALINGYGMGVIADNASATLTNYGTVSGASDYGVEFTAGGLVTDGAPRATSALIEGNNGVVAIGAYGTVNNYGTIDGEGGAGVILASGGQVRNGGGVDRTALIEGTSDGIRLLSGLGTVTNSGTVIGAGGVTSYGIRINDSGSLSNGSATNSTALVEGYSGLSSNALAENFGTILGLGDIGGNGAFLTGGVLANEAKGLIEGFVGATGSTGPAVLANYGRIVGDGGVAVTFSSSSDVLAVGAGSSFVGQILGGGGTLELANGTGMLTGLLAGNNVTVSGSMATTTFNNFATVQINSVASFALAGTGGTIATGQALAVYGTLSGAGTLTLTGGNATFGTGASLTIAKVSQSGGVASFTGTNVTVTDAWTQLKTGTVSVATGDRVSFAGTDSFSGTLTGAGQVYFTGGTDALTATTLSAASMVVSGGSVTLSGAIGLSKLLTVASPNLTVAAAGATLSGAGTLYLNTLATSAVIGASATATLTNSDKIQGTGQLGDGQLTLINAAAGSINAELTTALTINTGTGSFSNAGLVESTNTGGLTITGALTNTGTLTVNKGTLLVGGAVTGTGTVKIGGGTADFASTFSENVAFTSTTGVLELSHSQTYTGQVTGLSKTGASSLDLLDITFGGTTKATFSGTATSGTLTVTDGTHTSHITLEGNYVGHTFTASSDGHGGTTVVDPSKPPSAGHVVPLVTAMAGFGGGPDAGLDRAPRNDADRFAMLAAPA